MPKAITTLPLIVLCSLVYWRAAAANYLLTTASGVADLPASERGLTDIDCSTHLLAKEGNRYYKGTSERRFKGPVLGYVTPWNSHGYDVAKRWRGKLTHVSPVWYQLRADADSEQMHLVGGHDVDKEWLKALREPVTEEAQCATDDAGTQTCSADAGALRAPPLIVPRVIVELSPQGLLKLVQAPEPAIDMIVKETQTHDFDGIVLEGWLQWASMGLTNKESGSRVLTALVMQIAHHLHAAGKVLLLAIPPVEHSDPHRAGTDIKHMQQLAASVDGFSLMTYDFSATAPGPNAPLPWQEHNARAMLASTEGSGATQVRPEQVLLGLNFYGYDWKRHAPSSSKGSSRKGGSSDSSQPVTGSPIMGDAFLALLRRVKAKLKWEEEHAEHRIKYKEGDMRHTVYYPTPAALAARIKLAEQLGVGLSIWELGQGLDSFMDLL